MNYFTPFFANYYIAILLQVNCTKSL